MTKWDFFTESLLPIKKQAKVCTPNLSVKESNMKTKEYWIKSCREYGRTRIAISNKAKSKEDWNELWHQPEHAYAFKLGPWWSMTVEYKVDDFEAEVGFYTDILGFRINALEKKYAMFTSPNEEFHISIVPKPDDADCTPQEAIKIEFMVQDIVKLAEELKKRGIIFDREPCPYGGKDSGFLMGYFRTPHGIRVTLWCMSDS